MTPPNSNVNHFTQADREVIYRLTYNQEHMSNDLKDFIKTMNEKFQDHELRLRALEKTSDDFGLVKKIVYSAVGIILIAFFSAIIALTIKQP